MRRNNEDRIMKGHKPTPTEDVPTMPNPLDFVTPTQFVELPSKGRYPQGHPLHGQSSIEIKYMTAKDEDILTNRSLLKKGLAIDRLIRNVIKDKTIDASSLYMGDRNAILIYARASAYGNDYTTKVSCPSCGEKSTLNFDLFEHEVYHGDNIEGLDVEDLQDGTFKVILPLSKVEAVIRPLNGRDELAMVQGKKDPTENLMTNQMKTYTVSFNGYADQNLINQVVDAMTAVDSKVLRDAFKLVSPDVKMETNFECPSCGNEEVIRVPLGADFFWPER